MKNTLQQQLSRVLMQSHKDDQILYSRTKETMENWKTKTFSIDHPAQHISSVWENIIRESVELQSRHYIDLPYPKFSERFGGIRKGEVVVFGGRPSMGKTNVLIHLALHISHVNKTLFLSPDIHERALINRFISLQTNLPLSIINSGNPNDVEMKKIMDAATHLAEKKSSSMPIIFMIPKSIYYLLKMSSNMKN